MGLLRGSMVESVRRSMEKLARGSMEGLARGSVRGLMEHQWRNGTTMEHTGSQVDSRGRCEGTASIVSRKGWYFFLVGQMCVVH